MTEPRHWHKHVPVALFKSGEFELKSGGLSRWKIDCDALTDADWATLAAIGAPLAGPFNRVFDCGGASMQFADALRRYSSAGGWPLIVDDVFTTGTTMRAVRENILAGVSEVRGLVVFARTQPPAWVRAMFQWNGGD